MRTLCRRNKFHVKHDGFHVPHPSTKRCVYMCIFFFIFVLQFAVRFFFLCLSFSLLSFPFPLVPLQQADWSRKKTTNVLITYETKNPNTIMLKLVIAASLWQSFFFLYLVCLFSLAAAFIQCTRNIYTDAKSVRFFFLLSLQCFNIFGSFEKAESMNCPRNDYQLWEDEWNTPLQLKLDKKPHQHTSTTHTIKDSKHHSNTFWHLISLYIQHLSVVVPFRFVFVCCSGATVCK